jgi:hypothetical protein
MQKLNYKSKISAIALILTLTLPVMMFVLPLANAHTPAWEIPTYAYISAQPNPVGVNEQVIIVAWVNWPLPGADRGNDIRFTDYELTITDPQGASEQVPMSTTDPTSTSYVLYTPNQVGEYTLEFTHPDLEYTWSGAYQNDTFLGSSASETLVVQTDPVVAIPGTPLPTEYWTRPIEGENTNWWAISSNWLGRDSGQILGGGNWGGGGIQTDISAPNTPHVMWAKPLEDGGVVGGLYGDIFGETYYTGLSYEGRYDDPLIIHGRLYYDTPLGNNPSNGPYRCVDLRTGELIWENPDISPHFGQLYYFETPNQHGVIPSGYLWQAQGSTWRAYDPRTGQNIFNMTNVPSGLTVYSEKGEILRYVLDYPNRKLRLWNNTASPALLGGPFSFLIWMWRPEGKTVNMSDAYSWEVNITDLPGLGSPQILSVLPGDIMLGTSTNFAAFNSFLTPDPYTFWAINLDPDREGYDVGDLIWIQNYTAPPGNMTVYYLGTPNVNNLNLPVDEVNRVFFTTLKETSQWVGYSLDNGSLLWGPVGDFPPTQYFGTTSNPPAIGYPAYGNLYTSGYGGILYAFDGATGDLVWTYGNGGPGNSTYSGYDTPWGNYPIFPSAIADGKIYLFTSEHSPNTPPYKGARIRAVDAETGEEIWTMLGWHASGGFGQWATPIADGYLNFYNVYDARVYVIGKGPSATTVTAPDLGAPLGRSVMIRGTVIDIAAGTKQDEQAARFPYGVPAVSDESMGPWMEYVYMQKTKPTDTVGVDVLLSIRDPNGNFHDVTVTSDSSGTYSLMYEPPVPGEYTVYAIFQGTEGYWPSQAQTTFGVDEAPPTGGPIEPEPSPTPTPTPSPTPSESPTPTPSPTPSVTPEAPLITTEVAIIIVVVVAAGIGLVSYWILRRR